MNKIYLRVSFVFSHESSHIVNAKYICALIKNINSFSRAASVYGCFNAADLWNIIQTRKVVDFTLKADLLVLSSGGASVHTYFESYLMLLPLNEMSNTRLGTQL